MTSKPTSRKPKDLTPSLSKLALSPAPHKSSKSAKRPPTPPDSWEEDADSDDSPSTPTNPHSGAETPPGPPPPTPISPTHRRGKTTDWAAFPADPSAPLFAGGGGPSSSSSFPSAVGGTGRGDRADAKRPEKSVATAGRLIAQGLGQKVAVGEEGRKYERALREKAAREREGRRRAEREGEERRREVWDG